MTGAEGVAPVHPNLVLPDTKLAEPTVVDLGIDAHRRPVRGLQHQVCLAGRLARLEDGVDADERVLVQAVEFLLDHRKREAITRLEGQGTPDDIVGKVLGTGDRDGAQAILGHHDLHDAGRHVLGRRGDIEKGLARLDIPGPHQAPDFIKVRQQERAADVGGNSCPEVVGIKVFEGAHGDPALAGGVCGEPFARQGEGSVDEDHALEHRQQDRVGGVRATVAGRIGPRRRSHLRRRVSGGKLGSHLGIVLGGGGTCQDEMANGH